MDYFANPQILKLDRAESHFLQILLTKFQLRREGQGAHLELYFDGETPAIWRRKVKLDLRNAMPDFADKSARYQRELDAVLLHQQSDGFDFDDPDYCFRHANGGALPIVRLGRREYYCFFYRDIFPVGWNIANGGSDSRDELIDPGETIERELREELLIWDVRNRRRYVFDWDGGKPLDRPEFEAARRHWAQALQGADPREFTEEKLPLKWYDGPDTLTVRTPIKDEIVSKVLPGCFLNINALDFGIEVDRIAKINVDKDAILLDGEFSSIYPVDRPIGLFEVDRLHALLGKGAAAEGQPLRLFPDILYHTGRQHAPEELPDLVRDKLVPRLEGVGVRSKTDSREYLAAVEEGTAFDLCPVTRRIVLRHLARLDRKVPDQDGYEVFVSCSGEDVELGGKVSDFLQHEKGKKVFFYPRSIQDANWSRVIDNALDEARYCIAVGSRLRNLMKGWVEYEWRTFHISIMNERKPDGQLLSFVGDIDPRALPQALSYWQCVKYDPRSPDPALEQLGQFVT